MINVKSNIADTADVKDITSVGDPDLTNIIDSTSQNKKIEK